MKNKFIVTAVAIALMTFSTAVRSNAQDESRANVSSMLHLTEEFSPNSVTIPTSEGSPYGFCDFWPERASQCFNESNFGYGPTKVLQVYICLSGEVSVGECSQQPEVTGPLSSTMLTDIDTKLGAFAGSGIRLLLRFTYNFGPIGPGAMDAPIDVISQHIDQLAPIVIGHKDLIFALEAGFIGTWGEWHDSTNGNDTATAQKLVLDKELSYFKGLFPILVRYPGDFIQYAGGLNLVSGLGLHDDFYASNSDDGGTWNPCDPGAGYCLNNFTPHQFRTFASEVSASTMFAGEFGAVYSKLESCDALNNYSYEFHVQSITLHPFPAAVGTFLQNEGCALSFYNKVGTRIVLGSVKVSGHPTPGAKLSVELTMVNDGYGRVIRERPVTLVLQQNGRHVATIPIPTTALDLRTLAAFPAEPSKSFNFELALPQNISAGTTTMVLIFQDPAPTLTNEPAYALPLNSVDQNGNPVFDPTTGRNWIATFDINQ